MVLEMEPGSSVCKEGKCLIHCLLSLDPEEIFILAFAIIG